MFIFQLFILVLFVIENGNRVSARSKRVDLFFFLFLQVNADKSSGYPIKEFQILESSKSERRQIG